MTLIRRHVPNALTILRILLMAPFIIALAYGDESAAIIITILILATDYFDGFLARKWHSITSTGKVLDPLADKICSAAAAIALICYKGYPLWLFLAIVSRDVIILLAGLILIRSKHFVPVSNMSGKIAVGFIALSLAVYLFNIQALKRPVEIAAAIALFVSFISYTQFFIKTARSKRAPLSVDEY